jgi:hypothetical protein
MSRQGLPDLKNKTGDAPPALTAKAGSDGPTARARAEGKRGPTNPPTRPRHYVVGERLAPDKGQSSVCGAAMRSLHAAPLPHNGEGEVAEGGVLPGEDERMGARQQMCLNRHPDCPRHLRVRATADDRRC